MAALARQLGVSKNTISLALRGDNRVSAATCARVRTAAARADYALNPVVSHLMTELRRSGTPLGRRRTLALINGYRTADAFRRHPTIPAYVAGCRRRAAALGYGIDTFWLHSASLDGRKLERILTARGIRGVILIGMMDNHRLPDRFSDTWSQFACAVTGVRTEQPELSFCCVDHHMLVVKAVEHAVSLGYRRPALVLDQRIDDLVDGRFGGAMLTAQQTLAAANRVAPFRDLPAARSDPALFHRWLKREKPDVLLTLYTVVRRWVESAGLSVPGDIGLIQMEKRPDSAEWAGMDQHNDLVGEAAVDMVVSQIHRNERGPDNPPRATLIEPSWVFGNTVRAAAL
jgi:LacI family transcriptional regulator